MRPDGIGIVGVGHAGRALAVYLSARGHKVRLYTGAPEHVDGMRRHGIIQARGAVEGRFPVAEVTCEPERLAETSEIILIASGASAYPEIARAFAPHLTRRHVVIVYSAKLCGSLELLRSIGLPAMDGPAIVEMGSLFDCRAQDDDGVWLRGISCWTLFSAVQRSETMRLASRMREIFPDIEPAANLVQRAITEFDALAHALISVASPRKIERGARFRFDFDGEGLSARMVALLESVAHEFADVCRAFGSPFIGAKDRLDGDRSRDSRALLAEICVAPHNAGCFERARVERSLREDVLSTLVPLRGLARKASLETAVVDEVIGFASALLQEDLTKTGRSLERLGWHSLSHREIVRLMQS